MRVVLIGVFPYRDSDGGAAGRLRNIGLALGRAGAQPALWFAGSSELPRSISWEGIPVVQFGGTAPARPGRRWDRVHGPAVGEMVAELKRLGRAGRLDAVLFYNQDAVYAWRVARACANVNVPFFQQYAELHLPSDYARGWRASHFLLEWLHLRLAPRLSAGSIVISTELAGRVRKRARREPLVLANVAAVRPALPRRVGPRPRVLCVSTGARRDELPLLLRAHAQARREGGDLVLDVVGLGPGCQASLAALAHELGITDSVRLRGVVSETDYAEELELADAYALLRSDDRSSRACYPSKLNGMFATGAPIILSAVGDIAGHFQDRRDCLLVPPGDVGALASALGWLARHPQEAAEIGRRGNERARVLFDVDAAGRRLRDYLQSCLGSSASP